MELCLESLVVEITRRCNMKCPHCLRGNAQRVDIGFFSSSGYGDGGYDVYAYKCNGQITALEIRFI